ncbi:MAG: hypothetical protein OXF20_02710 [Gammaproteobacteria bacterium]|nr:hypothetical protein [Gammaproteobacteria bacterium]
MKQLMKFTPPPLAKLAALLLLAVIAVPAGAQVPTVEMLGGAFNRCSDGCPEAGDGTDMFCTQAGQNISIGIGISEGSIAPPTDLTVRVLALTRSGHDRFRDYGVPVYIDETDTRTIRSLATVTIPAGSDSKLSPQSMDPICWKNDHLDTGDSEVEIVIVGGTGYRVNPARNSLSFTIREDDHCESPGNRTVYVPIGGNMNNTCVCRTRAVAARLYPGSVKQADGQDWTHSLADYYVTINGNRSLRSSTDYSRYCLQSPYQGPGT